MLIALLAVMTSLFFGGGQGTSSKELIAQVKAHVADPVHQEALVEIIETRSGEVQACEQGLSDALSELARVHHAYASTATDFNAVSTKLQKEHRAYSKVLLKTRREMKKYMTQEEWAAVFAPPAE